jgi:RimJ/RimL family protein N-acetyltransferase
MHEITPSQVTAAVTALFDRHAPTVIRAFAVMDGGNLGRILVDDADPPRYAFVWEADDGGLYRGGVLAREQLAEAMRLLRDERLVALPFRLGDPCIASFPPDPSAAADALEHDRPLGATDLSPLYACGLPTGYEIHRMDEALWQRSPKRAEVPGRYRSMDDFLERGIAACITRGNETACEAYADIAIDGVRELGIFTEAPHRGRGLATIACAQLIAWCEQDGCSTYWDCVAGNTPSRLLARKLGFRNERPYKLLAWFGPSFRPSK